MLRRPPGSTLTARLFPATHLFRSVDVPTGLDSTTGDVLSGIAVQADITVSFIGQKLGLHTGCGPAISGERRFDDLAVPATADRKSKRLNSRSSMRISYAVFCLKKQIIKTL